MSTAQGNCRGFFEGLHPLSPLASQLLLNSFCIHAHDASKESRVYQGLSGFRCVLRSSSDIIPEEVVPLPERWRMNHADDGMDTVLCTFRNQLCLSSKAEEGSASGLCLAIQLCKELGIRSSKYAYPVGLHYLVREISGVKYSMNRLVDIQSVREE